MTAHVLQRQFPTWSHAVWAAAAALVLAIGFSVVWAHEQILTEVLVECVVGYAVLFSGRWWLEGFGLGARPVVPAESA
jgi:hypothetical protein